MSDRTPIVAANWKMQKTVAETEEFLDAFVTQATVLDNVEIVICPPATSLAAATGRTAGTAIRVGAQNMHWADSGAYTGELSHSMLTDLDVEDVILGHSERRTLFGETDAELAKKVPVALANGLEPIFCCGETQEEREADETNAVLKAQVEAGLAEVADEDLGKVVIAYEPVWAIGTGLTASAEQANDACAYIRSLIAARNPEAAEQIRILYGGSVKPGNAAELFGCSDIDGGLVGGASLDPADFLAICKAA